jgi:long-chain acyl-CoA synthetase
VTTDPAALPPDAGPTIVRLARWVELALAEVELSPSQYRALAFLSEDGAAAAASALAGRMSLSKPTITALVDGLVHRGLVERRPSEVDRRRVEHLLTDEGRRVLLEADHLDAGDRASAMQGLRPWARALSAARNALLTGD